jgi:hypothetical protein
VTQTSFPLIGDELTDEDWRALFSDLDCVLGNPGGTAYAIGLPTSGNDITIGTGRCRVAGFAHEVTTTEAITIPAPTGGNRTDIITVRYSATWPSDGNARPCRLNRVAGTVGAGAPTLDLTAPGVQELPLWAITRAPSQALALAVVQDMRQWWVPRIARPSGAPPAAPTLGMEWLQPDTGNIWCYDGGVWRLLRTVGAQRQGGTFTFPYTASHGAGEVLFRYPFAVVPRLYLHTDAVTGNTSAVINAYNRSTTGFRWFASLPSGGSYNGTQTIWWTAEVL